MNLKELNQAENKLVVGGIKVLGSMEGPGVVSIKQNIDSLQNAVQTVTQKTEDYWSDIANDNIITPSEKKVLKKEWNTIQTTYSAILDLAREKGIDQTEDFINYANYYQALYNYLFQKIKVFDNMAENTPIPNITTYQTHFNNYYDQEIICQSVLNATSSTFTVRNLNSLDETGTANEIAMYNGQFYRYNIGTHEWEYVSAGKYMGIMNSLPDPVIDSYFLAGIDFTRIFGLLTNKGVLTLHNGTILGVKRVFKKGEVYVFTSNGWQWIVNHNDYRYLIATNDLVSIGAAISPNLEESIKPPHYINKGIDIPKNYRNGDWFLYTGVDRDIEYDKYITHFEYGKLYKFNSPVWAELDPHDSNNTREFMEALNDILIVHTANDGYFNTIFAQSLISNKAFIQNLATEIITLTQDPNDPSKTGVIQSDNFTPGGKEGFRLTHDGNAIFQKGTFSNIELTDVDIDGYFSGILNCGQLNVIKKGIEVPTQIEQAATVNNLNLINQIAELFGYTSFIPTTPKGVEHQHEKKIEDLYNDRKKLIRFNNKLLYKLKVGYVTFSGSMGDVSTGELKGITEDNTEYSIIKFNINEGIQQSIINGELKFTEIRDEKLVLQLDVPTQEPMEPNFVWNDNGILKLSKST